MLTRDLKLLDRINFKFVSKVLPVKKPETLLLDQLEIAFKRAKVNQVTIPSIALPQITSDFCIAIPALTQLATVPPYIHIVSCPNIECNRKLSIRINKQLIGIELEIRCPICKKAFPLSLAEDEVIHDLTTWIEEQLFPPEIESFNILLKGPRRAGKS